MHKHDGPPVSRRTVLGGLVAGVAANWAYFEKTAGDYSNGKIWTGIPTRGTWTTA